MSTEARGKDKRHSVVNALTFHIRRHARCCAAVEPASGLLVNNHLASLLEEDVKANKETCEKIQTGRLPEIRYLCTQLTNVRDVIHGVRHMRENSREASQTVHRAKQHDTTTREREGEKKTESAHAAAVAGMRARPGALDLDSWCVQ